MSLKVEKVGMPQDFIYDLSAYTIGSVVTEAEVLGFPEARECIEYDFVHSRSDQNDWLKRRVTEDMLQNGLYHVGDPLIRSAILLKSGELSDICFLVGDLRVRFDVHKFLLASSSPVFFTMFYGSLPMTCCVEIPEVFPKAFQIMLEYIYSGLIPKKISAGTGIALLYVARKYLLGRLESLVLLILKASVNHQNVFLLLETSYFYEHPTLTDLCQAFIDANIQDLITLPEFLDIDAHTLMKILESDNLQILEIDLFNAMLKWSGHLDGGRAKPEWANDPRRIAPLLKYIRFPTMSAAEFANGPGVLSFLEAEEVCSILLYICSTGPLKPSCNFLKKPRNYIRPSPKESEVSCECEAKRLTCFFCFGPLQGTCRDERGLTTLSLLRGVTFPTPRRRSAQMLPTTPECYCPCRTRGSCPVAARRSKSGKDSETGRLETTPNRNADVVLTHQSPRRHYPVGVYVRAQEARLLRGREAPRAGWRI